MVFSFPDRGVAPSLVSRNPNVRPMQTVLPHAHGEVDSGRATKLPMAASSGLHQGILTIGGASARLDTDKKIPKAKIQISQARTERS
jgi:hypothetical protein